MDCAYQKSVWPMARRRKSVRRNQARENGPISRPFQGALRDAKAETPSKGVCARVREGTTMENWLKRGKDESEVIAADGRAREEVEGILRDISERGDEAVRD